MVNIIATEYTMPAPAPDHHHAALPEAACACAGQPAAQGRFSIAVVRRQGSEGCRLRKAPAAKAARDSVAAFATSLSTASILTLGFGWLGRSRRPCATVGAALGSNLSRKLGMAPRDSAGDDGMRRPALASPAYSRQPVAGMMFTLEVVKVRIGTMSVMALTLACSAAHSHAMR